MTTAFDKIEGLGNDFVVVESTAFDGIEPEICDRHRGVGADGVLHVDVGARSMRVVNADGSRPEMCGNGIRCVMLWLAQRGVVKVGETLAIATDAGPHACTLLALEGARADVRVAMRAYAIDPDPRLVRADAPMLDAPLVVDGTTVIGSFVSMGNPHFVAFDAEKQGISTGVPPTAADTMVSGPRWRTTPADARVRAIQEHPMFPARINVGLAEQTGNASITLRVFERGVGYTEACGTGACAAAAAAVETGRIARGVPIAVTLPGGVLEIVVGDRGAPVLMTGPARWVFRGSR